MCAAPETEQGEGVCLESMSLKASLNRLPLSSWLPNGRCEILTQSLGIVQLCRHQCSLKALWIFICGNLLRCLINRQGKRNWELMAAKCLFSKQEPKATGWKSLSETVFSRNHKCKSLKFANKTAVPGKFKQTTWMLSAGRVLLVPFSVLLFCTKPPVVFLSEEDNAPRLRYSVYYELVNGSEFF